MALSKSTITGRVPLPTDENLQFAELTFALSGLDTEGASVLPGGVSTRAVLVGSDIPAGFELWQNTAGLRGTNYQVLARWTVKDRDGIRDQYADLGVIQIGSDPSYTLADLINNGVPPAIGTFWSAITQAQYDAVIQAAADAQASAVAAALYDGPRFGTIALMQAGTGFADGKLVRVDKAFNGEQEGFVYDAASTLTADGALIVDATGMGVGRLISTRTVYADFATLDADLRVLADGTILTVDGGARCEVVAAGQDYTLTSGRKIRLLDNEGIISSAIAAAANGVTNDAAAWLALDVAAVRQASVPAVVAGTHLIDTDITLDAGVLGRGGILKPGVGRTVTINGEVRGDLRQIFDASLGTIKLGKAQDVRPEWWGSGNTALHDAFKKSAAGSRILLRGVEYQSVAIVVNNDPLATDGADTGKVIQGVSTAQRYTMTGAFYGSRIKLANGQNTNLFTAASGGANAWGSGGLRDMMLIGNQTNNTAGSGVEFANVKDWVLHNVYAWGFKEDGLKFSGANNQISLTGYIELWNNVGRGLNGLAIGDPQWDASIRCVNNGGYDCYIAEGNGRINQIYCYFGGGFRHDGIKPLHLNYLRVEDCDGIGADLRGYLIVDAALISDNGVLGSTGADMCGVYVRAGAKVHIKDLSSANRTAAVHKQRHLLYSLAGECRIDYINDDAFGVWGVASEQTLLVTNNTALAGSVSVGTRRAISDTYANLKDVGASITPKPGTYDRYQVSAVTQSMTINNTAGNTSCEGMEMAFQITSSGSYNINWGADYLDAAGAALSATALTVGQTARARFRQLGGKWRLIAAISIA